MNSADASRGEHFDSGAMRNPTGRCDGRGAIPFASNSDGYVSRAQLLDLVVFGQLLDLSVGESHAESPAHYCDCRWNGVVLFYDCLQALGRLEIERTGQAMGDQGRLERYDGLLIGECGFHIRFELDSHEVRRRL